jgi:hypothetical protein
MEDQMTQPGHFLTALLDTMKRTSGFSSNDAKAVRNLLDLAARRGIKFLGPQAAEVDKSKPLLLSDLRPPYPITVIEGELFDSNGVGALIVARDTGDYVELNFFVHTADAVRDIFSEIGEWIIAPLTCRIPYSDTTAHAAYEMEVKSLLPDRIKADPIEPNLESYRPYLRFYLGVCQILANHNVELTDIKPDAKENRVRRIRGKAPLYTYKTLIIGAPKARQVGRGGGTHASPRSHLRRGFYRTSKTGVRHWVNATMVKGETPGFVHKDYQIQQGAN